MKVDGITLLQMIRDGNIKDKTKFTCGYCHRYVICYNKELYWGYSNDFNVNDEIKYKPFNFAFANEKPEFRKLEQFQLMNTTFELIEEDKELKIQSNFSETQNGMTKIDREKLDNNFRAIDSILKDISEKVNKLNKEMNK